MIDTVPDLLLELEGDLPVADATRPTEIDEAAYLTAFPDIAAAVHRGEWKSAQAHYTRHGQHENRVQDRRYLLALTGHVSSAVNDSPTFPHSGVDVVFVSADGLCLAIGWIDDRADPLETVAIVAGREPLGATRRPARCRRPDAEDAVGLPAGHLMGFWAVLSLPRSCLAGGECQVMLTAAGKRRSFPIQPKYMDPAQLRDTIFEYLAGATYFGNPSVESFLQLDRGPGPDLLRLNAHMSSRISARADAARFGPLGRRFRGSIVVCLCGKHEFFFLQSALFSAVRNCDEYEFIYVCNSPELTEVLQKEATIAERMYGLSQTLVFLPGNAGFGAANNVAVNFAQSNRILITNPDVFPRNNAWADRHTQIVEELPSEQTAMFGVPLFYDDGSLMHSGMFFEVDAGLSVKPEGIIRQMMVRVEHYAKGAPPNAVVYHRSRPVPALTGAFISADRDWFEKLGGFCEEYAFGHYEDSDLCLKSLDRGRPVWLHDLPMWHLEGKGSTRRPAHEGGSLLNRWHFTKTWGDFIVGEFTGRTPRQARLRAARP